MRFASVSTFFLVSLSLAGCAVGGVTPAGDGGRDAGHDAGEGGAGEGGTDLGKDDLGPQPDLGPPDMGCTDDSACDDHLACDGVETCVAGSCVPGTAMTCDDSVPCTTDACLEPGMCQHTPDATRCVSPQLCDLTMGCVTPPACSGDAMCDDHIACDGVEHCDPAIGCQPGTAVSCDDGMACTADTCLEPMGTCSHVPQDADRDGYPLAGCAGGTDCNDLAATVHPGAVDVCDGIDNDCDGVVDNGPGLACAQGSTAAACSTACGTPGTQVCTAACTRGPCIGPEVCNNCDDDSDGTIDNGFACRRGVTVMCTTMCSTAGSQTCASDCSGYSRCNAPTEICGNACDDNGNGLVDEGCAAMPPPNDQCSGAAALAGTSGTTTGTLTGATAQTSDCSTGADVFYSVTVGGPSLIYLDTIGSTFDTKIAYRGTSCGGASITCSDDACSSLQTQIVASVASAGTYYFSVHPFSSGTTGVGTFQLRWQVLPRGTSGATQIYGTGTYSGTTVSGSSGVSGSCTSATGPDYSYFWTQCPSDTHNVAADLCSGTSFDTVLYLDGVAGALTCNDDYCGSGLQSQIFSTTTSGVGIFELVVDGYSTVAYGSYQLNVSSF